MSGGGAAVPGDARAAGSGATQEGETVYLYGFVPHDAKLPPAGLLGIADRPVELVDLAGFRAAVSRVPEAYRPSEIEPRLRDLAWVGEQGVRHEEVVACFVDHAEIVPARLLTLYSSPDALVEAAAGRADAIRDRLRRFAGRREWDLKVSYDAERLASGLARLSEAVAACDAELAAATPGKRFLLERRRAELVRTESVRAAARLASEVAARARPYAVEQRSIAPPADADGLPVVLNLALLVEKASEPVLRGEVEAAAATAGDVGVHVTFSGPWAPYRFLAEAS